MAAQTGTLASIDRVTSNGYIFLPVRLNQHGQRRTLLTSIAQGPGGRHESRTQFLLRALSSEVARCQADGGCIDDLEVLRQFAGEDLGLSPQQLQALGMGPGLPAVKRVKRRKAKR